MMFASAVRKRREVEPTGRVIAAAADSATAEEATLLQSLVDPDADLEARAFSAAGFDHLAELLYMQRSVPRGAKPPEPPAGVRCLPYSDALRGRFAAVLEASYEDTKDCPALRGMRDIDDVLIGHRSAGQFDPALWTLLSEGDEPVGVALVNRLDEMRGAELVYLGLAPAGRGKGYGSLLVRRGLALAGRAGAGVVTLAVDRANDPAVRLYRRLGFYRVARKRAMIKRVTRHGDGG